MRLRLARTGASALVHSLQNVPSAELHRRSLRGSSPTTTTTKEIQMNRPMSHRDMLPAALASRKLHSYPTVDASSTSRLDGSQAASRAGLAASPSTSPAESKSAAMARVVALVATYRSRMTDAEVMAAISDPASPSVTELLAEVIRRRPGQTGAALDARDAAEMDRQMGMKAAGSKMPHKLPDGRFVMHNVRPSDVRAHMAKQGR